MNAGLWRDGPTASYQGRQAGAAYGQPKTLHTGILRLHGAGCQGWRCLIIFSNLRRCSSFRIFMMRALPSDSTVW